LVPLTELTGANKFACLGTQASTSIWEYDACPLHWRFTCLSRSQLTLSYLHRCQWFSVWCCYHAEQLSCCLLHTLTQCCSMQLYYHWKGTLIHCHYLTRILFHATWCRNPLAYWSSQSHSF
jgi:hypothetical protein